MREFLVFQLYGPMASWGDVAVGEYRPTMNYPSKSAVHGLLAAALGIRRHEEDKHAALHNGYGFAVCVIGTGELLRDYHTAQVPTGNRTYSTRRDELCYDPSKLSTILSQRDYRMDSLCLVALWQKQPSPFYSLQQLQQKLSQPHFVLYLGRKSCPPALPLNPHVLEEKTLKQAFTRYPCDEVFKNNRLRDNLVSYFWEQDGIDASSLGLEPVMTYPRRDQVISRGRWQFAIRDEYTCMEPMKGDSICF